MLRSLVPSQLKKRKQTNETSSRNKKSCQPMRTPLSPSKRINVKNGSNASQIVENKLSHDEYIRKILSRPFVIPIPNYNGLYHYRSD